MPGRGIWAFETEKTNKNARSWPCHHEKFCILGGAVDDRIGPAQQCVLSMVRDLQYPLPLEEVRVERQI